MSVNTMCNVMFAFLVLAPSISALPQDAERRTPVVQAIERVTPAVVNVQGRQRVAQRHGFFPGLFSQPEQRSGSIQELELGAGVIVHADGIVITNEHVIHGAEDPQVTLADGRKFKATLINASLESDLALLKIDAAGPFPTATFANSAELLIGETTIALGNPLGLGMSATAGILSAINRKVEFEGKPVFTDFLQTSADINPGNSGGPLLDIQGRIIGINTAIDRRGQSIGFAIPANRVREVMDELASPELVNAISLGFECEARADGLYVKDVGKEGPAAKAGARAGDRILSIGGRKVSTPFDLKVSLLRVQAGEKVGLTTQSKNGQNSLSIETVAVQRRFGKLILGMEVADMSPNIARHLSLRVPEGTPVVVRVEEGSEAHRCAIAEGDVLVSIGRVNVRNTAQVLSAFEHYAKSNTVPVRVWRNGRVLEGTLSLRDG
jgi:serine protease Do